jgi:hypothetical protein
MCANSGHAKIRSHSPSIGTCILGYRQVQVLLILFQSPQHHPMRPTIANCIFVLSNMEVLVIPPAGRCRGVSIFMSLVLQAWTVRVLKCNMVSLTAAPHRFQRCISDLNDGIVTLELNHFELLWLYADSRVLS